MGPGAVSFDRTPHPFWQTKAPDGTDVGARLWFRYVDGELMDSQADGGPQYLWPWPMEQRIWQATSDYYLLDPENHPPPCERDPAGPDVGWRWCFAR